MKIDSNANFPEGWGDSLDHGKYVSRAIVGWLTEIVNQPFPSKVHALTAEVTPPKQYLRRTAEVTLPTADKIGQFGTGS